MSNASSFCSPAQRNDPSSTSQANRPESAKPCKDKELRLGSTIIQASEDPLSGLVTPSTRRAEACSSHRISHAGPDALSFSDWNDYI